MRSVKLLRLYLIFANIESLFSLLMVFAIPGDSKNALILGFSSARLLLGAFLLAILGGVSWLNLKCLASEEFTKTLLNLVKIIVQRKFVWRLVIGGFASLVLIGLSYFFIITVSNDDPYQSIMVRLAPLTLLITLISCQTLLVFPRVFLWPEDRTVIEYKILFNGLIAFVVLLFIIGGMAITGIGIQPPRNSWEFGWGDPAVPILTGQGLMAFGLGITYLAISTVGLRFLKRIRLSLSFIDLAFCLGIWGIGALLWTNQPFTTNWFAPAPRPPNFEHYPYSDAFTHDVIGQNVLIGEGLKWADHRIPRRPLYGLLLATLHFMIGQDYDRVIQWQIFVLALFPVGIYLIGAKLHHRATGVVGSVLVILRERNAIELSGTINVSHAKLMMSDLPTAVLVCGFTFLCILWLQNPKNYKNWPLLIGGLLGVTMLFRTQTVMLGVVPLLVSLAFLKKGESFLPWRKNTLILFAGILLVISPWLWRNWKITGGLIFDETNSQIGMIARRLSISPEDFDSNPRLGENEASYTRRMTQQAALFILQHPNEAAHVIFSNFFHSLFSTAIMLPTSAMAESAEAFVRRTGYWFKWEGPIKPETYFPLMLNLGLIAVGLGAVWAQHKWIGLLPVGIFLVYSMSNALATISGWRFMLPADWVGILYFSTGFIHICLYFGKIFGFPQLEHKRLERAYNNKLRQTVFITSIVGIIVIGLSIPLVEQLVPQRFVPLQKAQVAELITEGLLQNLSESAKLRVANTLAQPDSVILLGRGLYPRYFPANEGEPGGDWPSSSPRACDRLSLYLIGPVNADVFIPLNQIPEIFPNSIDIVVIGYPGKRFVEAAAIIPLDPTIPPLLNESQTPMQCPAF